MSDANVSDVSHKCIRSVNPLHFHTPAVLLLMYVSVSFIPAMPATYKACMAGEGHCSHSLNNCVYATMHPLALSC